MNAEILSVGTELLLGNIVNTDARDISVMLSELGINVYWHTVVGDNPARLTEAVEIARKRADIIITTGGLGPTCDDLTKQVLAKAFGLELYLDEAEEKNLREWFRTRHPDKEMTENNMQQVYLPVGCEILHNDWGTAPGCAFEKDGVHVLMLPGPPRECNPMFRERAMPYLRRLSDDVIVSHSLRVFGQGESAVEAKLRDMMDSLTNPTLAPYAKEGEVMLRVTAKAKSNDEAEKMIAGVIAQIMPKLGDVVYDVDVEGLEYTVFDLMSEWKLTLSAAESCTGGLLAKRMTDIPGSSKVFLGGVTVYSDLAKEKLLDIDPELIKENGAVSHQVAEAMAKSVRAKLGTHIGLGITGEAGPDASGDMPVGVVYVALATEDKVVCRKLTLSGGRSRIRNMAVNHALDMVRRALSGLPLIPQV